MDTKEVQFAIEVLHTLVTKNNKSLATGVQRREDLLAAIDRGEIPDGYRVDFLRDGAKRLIHELANIAKDFNEAHPEDRCTVQDFMDLLSTTIAWIKNKSEEFK